MPTGVELATAWVRLTPTMEGVQGEVTKSLGGVDDEFDKAGKRAGGKFSAGAKAAFMVAGAAVVAGIVKVFNTGLEEIKFGEKISAQTDILLKNTGFTMTTKQIEDFTLSLSKISGVSEESLQEAGNNVLKFGTLSEENYAKAVNSINDLAATGKDAASVGETLGKALSDPATAAGKLRKAGVALNETQEAQIAAFVATGDKAAAQGVILDALEGTYGGMAEAAGATAEGGINKLNNSFENLSADVVSALMPALTSVIAGLQIAMDWLTANQWVIPIFAAALGVLALGFIGVTVATWAMNTALLANPITWIVLAIVALIAAIVLLIMNWDAVVAFLTDVWNNVVDWLIQTLNDIGMLWLQKWNEVSTFFTTLWASIVAYFTNLWNALVEWFTQLLIQFALFILNKVNEIRTFWTNIWTMIVSFFTGIWNGVVSFITGVLTGIGTTIISALNWISNTWNSMWQGMADFLGTVFSNVVGVVKGVLNGIVGAINGIIGAINGIKVSIPDWVPGLGGKTFGISLPKLPMLATGGTITSAGYSIVGENGPELLKLPKGAQVNPDYDSVPDGKVVNFNNYAPLGKTPAQQLTEFSNRAKGL